MGYNDWVGVDGCVVRAGVLVIKIAWCGVVGTLIFQGWVEICASIDGGVGGGGDWSCWDETTVASLIELVV